MRNKYEEPIKGAVKDKAGEMINDPELETKREAERPDGRIQEKAGKARWKAGKGIKKAGRIITGRR